jgi:proline iminopeptidase
MRRDLYPEIRAFRQGMLAVDSTHKLYWEESGNPKGAPVVFLHGGPGAGASAGHRRFFDPKHYRIVIFDQRGAGRSTPFGSLENNTTPHLVDDIEALRKHLDIESWFVFGGSWGASLALAYGETHPDRCRGLILRGVFLCQPHEVDWFLDGMKRVFPEIWRRFQEFLPEEERGDLLANYHRRLIDPNPRTHNPAAAIWSQYEGACSTLLPNPSAVGGLAAPDKALGLARIEAHYFVNSSFMEEGALLARADRLKDIPGVIVQGRYDMVCPVETADALATAWPRARFVIVPDAGHSAMEPGIRRALVNAMERFKNEDG